jgi:hypothetical protein
LIDNSLLIGGGTLGIAGLVFNILWGQEVLSYFSRITLGMSCSGVLALSIWSA